MANANTKRLLGKRRRSVTCGILPGTRVDGQPHQHSKAACYAPDLHSQLDALGRRGYQSLHHEGNKTSVLRKAHGKKPMLIQKSDPKKDKD